MGTHYAGIDIHKSVFQAAVLDPATGEIASERFPAERGRLRAWAERWADRLEAVAIEATTGWRWVARELQALGLDVRLADPGRASALQGRRKKAKTDRLDARWLVVLLAKQMLPEAWLPPADIARLRDQTAPAQGALRRSHPLGPAPARAARARGLAVLAGPAAAGERPALAAGPGPGARRPGARRIDAGGDDGASGRDRGHRHRASPARRKRRAPGGAARDLRGGADPGLPPVGRDRPGHPLRRARQVVRAAGLDPVVRQSGERRRRGRLATQGSPQLRWALVEAAQHARRPASPDHELYRRSRAGAGANPATLTVARKIARRAFHQLRAVEAQAA